MGRLTVLIVTTVVSFIVFVAYQARTPSQSNSGQPLNSVLRIHSASTKSQDVASLMAMDLADGSAAGAAKTTSSSAYQSLFDTTISDDVKIAKLQQRLTPRLLDCLMLNDTTTSSCSCQPHQFLHLHHMKTGGTSVDGLLNCGLQRIQQRRVRTGKGNRAAVAAAAAAISVPYMNLHECSRSYYQHCVSGNDANCQRRTREAAVMSYCAPLHDLAAFDWPQGNNQDMTESTVYDQPPLSALTVLRHPVERVWSMFRFTTLVCYKCRNLTDVYAEIDQAHGKKTSMAEDCVAQLLNHQTTNLLSTTHNHGAAARVQEAMGNLESYFTLVGLTEHLDETAQMIARVFPWLAPWYNGTIQSSSRTCTLPHANTSPNNNRCGPQGGHWDLPPHPDEATARVILAHNQEDMQVYEAALQLFELQRRALNL